MGLRKGRASGLKVAGYFCLEFEKLDGYYSFVSSTPKDDLPYLEAYPGLYVRNMTLEQKRSVFDQVNDGLNAMHAMGVIHGNFSPRHVLLKVEGNNIQVKICGFRLHEIDRY